MAEWDESKHPRAKDGKFGTGDGSAASPAAKSVPSPGSGEAKPSAAARYAALKDQYHQKESARERYARMKEEYERDHGKPPAEKQDKQSKDKDKQAQDQQQHAGPPPKIPPQAAALITSAKQRSDDPTKSKWFDPRLVDQFKPEEISNIAARIASAKVTVNFQHDTLKFFSQDPEYKNTFQVATASNQVRDNRYLDMRAGWEQQSFGFDKKTPPEERPTYAAMNIYKDPNGSAPSYGACHFVLKDDVKERMTVTAEDSSVVGSTHQVGLVNHSDPQKLAKLLVGTDVGGTYYGGGNVDPHKRWAEAARDPSSPRPHADLGYVETQIHGGLRFDRDVAEIHVPSSWVDRTGAPKRMSQEHLAQLKKMRDSYKVKVFIDGAEYTQ